MEAGGERRWRFLPGVKKNQVSAIWAAPACARGTSAAVLAGGAPRLASRLTTIRAFAPCHGRRPLVQSSCAVCLSCPVTGRVSVQPSSQSGPHFERHPRRGGEWRSGIHGRPHTSFVAGGGQPAAPSSALSYPYGTFVCMREDALGVHDRWVMPPAGSATPRRPGGGGAVTFAVSCPSPWPDHRRCRRRRAGGDGGGGARWHPRWRRRRH